MANYFIDLGAYNGDSIRDFFVPKDSTVGKHYLRIERKGYHVFAIEASTFHTDSLQALANTALAEWGCKSFEIMNVVAYVRSGTVEFRCGEKDSVAYTLDKYSKGRVAAKEPLVVKPCIDVVNWIKEIIDPDDYVVVKMDIEGAEYDVIPKLIRTGAISLIDELYVELHMGKKFKLPIKRIYRQLNEMDHWAKLYIENRWGEDG